jgi:DNA ligase (NAD+)
MIQERINFLKDELNKYSYNYYVLDNPLISDFEYDKLYKELESIKNQEQFIQFLNKYKNA